MDDQLALWDADTKTSWGPNISGVTGSAGGGGHACHCITCCRKCGSCRTNPAHTAAMCMLLVKQKEERESLVKNERKWAEDGGT
jgi:hypothetical protein